MGATNHAESPKAQAPEETGPRLTPNGYCWNCAIRVDDGALFCEPFCKRQYEVEHPPGREGA